MWRRSLQRKRWIQAPNWKLNGNHWKASISEVADRCSAEDLKTFDLNLHELSDLFIQIGREAWRGCEVEVWNSSRTFQKDLEETGNVPKLWTVYRSLISVEFSRKQWPVRWRRILEGKPDERILYHSLWLAQQRASMSCFSPPIWFQNLAIPPTGKWSQKREDDGCGKLEWGARLWGDSRLFHISLGPSSLLNFKYCSRGSHTSFTPQVENGEWSGGRVGLVVFWEYIFKWFLVPHSQPSPREVKVGSGEPKIT